MSTTLPVLKSQALGNLGKVVSARDAVRLIRSGATLASGGFADIGFPEGLAIALEERFKETGAYSTQTGQPFHGKLDTCSAANWTAVPGQTGPSERCAARG